MRDVRVRVRNDEENLVPHLPCTLYQQGSRKVRTLCGTLPKMSEMTDQTVSRTFHWFRTYEVSGGCELYAGRV